MHCVIVAGQKKVKGGWEVVCFLIKDGAWARLHGETVHGEHLWNCHLGREGGNFRAFS